MSMLLAMARHGCDNHEYGSHEYGSHEYSSHGCDRMRPLRMATTPMPGQ